MNPKEKSECKNKMNPVIREGLDGYTSDHGAQFFQVDFFTRQRGYQNNTLNGGTWNLMTKAHGVTKSGFSNNPFLVQETDHEYEMRKKVQIAEIVEAIEKYQLDFFCLQEIDFLFPHPKDGQELTVIKERLKNELIAQLPAHFALLQSSGNVRWHQPVALLYNQSRLTLQQLTERPVLPNATGVYRATQWYFIDDNKNHKIVLMSAHLDYSVDYSAAKQLDQIFEENKQAGYCLICAGDMNHHPGSQMDQLIAPSDIATNVAATMTGGASGQYDIDSKSERPTLTVKDPRTQLPAAYDGVFVGCPSDCRAQVSLMCGYQVKLNDLNTASFEWYNDANVYCSAVGGQIYRDEKYRIRELEKRFEGIKKIGVSDNYIGIILEIEALRKIRRERLNLDDYDLISQSSHYKMYLKSTLGSIAANCLQYRLGNVYQLMGLVVTDNIKAGDLRVVKLTFQDDVDTDAFVRFVQRVAGPYPVFRELNTVILRQDRANQVFIALGLGPIFEQLEAAHYRPASQASVHAAYGNHVPVNSVVLAQRQSASNYSTKVTF